MTGEAVTLILSTIDRIKDILGELEQTEAEPEGNDRDLIDELERMVRTERGRACAGASPPSHRARSCRRRSSAPLRPGEVSLDELERAFRETAPEIAPAAAP